MERPGYDSLVQKVLYLFSAFNPFKKRVESNIEKIQNDVKDLVGLIGGKVSGPTSSVNNTVPVYDGITGKLLKAGTGVSIVSGNVGIGNSAPKSILDVQVALDRSLNVSGAFSSQVILSSRQGSTSNNLREVQIAATSIALNTTSSLTSETGAERMRITGAGNVGISTNNPSEKLHVIGNILASGRINDRDVAADGAKLDESIEVTSGVVYKKFAKTLNITSTSNTVTLFTVPSSKIAFMGFNEPKIVIHSYGSLATNDAVVRLTYQSHSGGGAITQDISLDKMSAAPYYNVLEIAALPKIIGPGAVTMSVVTAGTSGTVLIKGEVTW